VETLEYSLDKRMIKKAMVPLIALFQYLGYREAQKDHVVHKNMPKMHKIACDIF
jgi:hypothetical protein